MNSYWLISTGVCVMLLTSCTSRTRPSVLRPEIQIPQRISFAEVDENLLEKVFRSEFPDRERARSRSFGVYYLSIGEQDPKRDFMARFAKESVNVLPRSQAIKSEDGTVIDREHPNMFGIIFNIEEVRKFSECYVEVDVDHYIGRTSGSGMTYELRLDNGNWRIVKIIERWTS